MSQKHTEILTKCSDDFGKRVHRKRPEVRPHVGQIGARIRVQDSSGTESELFLGCAVTADIDGSVDDFAKELKRTLRELANKEAAK